MSGHAKHRALWQYFFPFVDAFVFIIDATDVDRIAVVRDELDRMVQHGDILKRNAPFLFVLNKIDKQGTEQVSYCFRKLVILEVTGQLKLFL